MEIVLFDLISMMECKLFILLLFFIYFILIYFIVIYFIINFVIASRKIGTSTYHLSEDGHLLFWGNNNMTRNISVIDQHFHDAHRGRGRHFVPVSQQPLLKVGITSLPPGVSRYI